MDLRVLIPLAMLSACVEQVPAEKSDTDSIAETGATSTTLHHASLLSFTTAEGAMVTERLLTIKLDSPALVTIECSADVTIGSFDEHHSLSSPPNLANHSLTLRGLLAETMYTCIAIVDDINSTVSFVTGSLPAVLTGKYETPIGNIYNGYMLFNTFQGNNLNEEHWLLIQDYGGNIRWYQSGDIGDGIIAMEYEPEAGGIIAGGGNRHTYPPSVYNLSGELYQRINTEMDHDIEFRSDSLYFPVSKDDLSCVERWGLTDKTKKWSWCQPATDIYHINSIAVSEDESTLLMTTHHQFEGIIKVDIATGEVVWTLTPDGSADFSVDVNVSGLKFQHDLSIIECESAEHDLCLLLYDNGSAARGYSQILKYGLNQNTMEADLLRSFTRDDWFEENSGGVSEIDDGNWLVTQASVVQGSGYSSYWIVDPKGDVIWEMKATTNNIAAYRARWVSACEIFNHTGMCP